MRIIVLLPLLIIAVNARPQTANPSPASNWKPIENESQNHRLRAENHETRANKATPMSNTPPKEPNKPIKEQSNSNTTSDFTLDTRTPPKIKLQHKFIEKKKPDQIENSHPGIAVPVDVDSFLETSTVRRAIIYRENKTPTTNSGISTWILLSGQSTTAKPVRKPTIKTTTSTTVAPVVNKTLPVTEKPIKPTIKVIKPLTTRKPKPTSITPAPTSKTTSSVSSTTLTAPATKSVDKKENNNNRVVTKIKASVLNAHKNKTSTTTTTPSTPSTTTSIVSESTIITTKKPEIETASKNTETNDLLQPEAKDGALDLSNEKPSGTTKRPRRPTNNNNKRKKNNNKNRRRKPAQTASEKMDNANSTKIAVKQKPIGTQIYNYLSREVMPTVGVGLVGLMVTAGLASYFLYPFGGLRRAYDAATDRKDYFYDEYATGGVAEEELIGKVIAGMPEHTEYTSNSYRTPLARKDYKNEVNYNYRTADNYFQYPYNEYQTVSVGSKIGYNNDVIEQQKETGYTVDDGESAKQQFVVGSIPKDFDQPITPVAVPEHGPRNLKIRRRRRRYAQNEKDNEILDFYETDTDKIKPYLRPKLVTTTTTTTIKPDKSEITTTEIPITEDTIVFHPEQPSIFTFLRNLLELKVRIGLDFLLKTTDSFSNYLRGVQERVNTVLRDERH